MTTARAPGARQRILGRLRLTRHAMAAALALSCVVGLLTLGGSAADASTPSITVYSGQHEQTTQSLITAFEKKTGINVTVRYDDEDTFTDEILAEKSHPVADVFYTENSPPLEYLQEKGMLARLNASTLAKTPSTVQLGQGRLGRGLGPGERAHLQPEPDRQVPIADHGHGTGQPQVPRQAGYRPG